MDEKTLTKLFKLVIAAILVLIVVTGGFVIRAMIYKPEIPRTAAERAIMDGEQAVKSDPKNVNARLGLAAAYAGSGRYGDAKKTLDIAIKLDPKNVKALYMLGVVYKDQGQVDKAIETFKKAAAIEGEIGDIYNDIYFELGKTYADKGDYSKAIESYEKAKNYGIPVYLLIELAMAYEKTDQIENAKITYLDIIERDIENTEALDALKRLGVSKDVIEEVQKSGRGH